MNASDILQLRIRANAGDAMQDNFNHLGYSIFLRIHICCRGDWWVIPNAMGMLGVNSYMAIISIQIEDKHFMDGKSKVDTKCLI